MLSPTLQQKFETFWFLHNKTTLFKMAAVAKKNFFKWQNIYIMRQNGNNVVAM
jgi:hypothetical protein